MALVFVAALVVAAPLLGAARERYPLAADPEAAGYPASLAVVLVSPADYVHESTGRLGDDGVWKGPHYQATMRASLGGDATIDWNVLVERATNARSAFLDNRAQDWGVVEQGTEPVERLVGGRPAAPIQASWFLTQAPPMAGEARYETGLTFSICGGRWAIVRFSALEPSGDSAGGSMGYGDYLVKGSIKPTVWNHDQMIESLHGVQLEGSLPAGRVTAARRGRTVVGSVTDCGRAPFAGQSVKLERRAGKTWKRVAGGRTTAAGRFVLVARTPGTYRVTAGSVRSAPLRAG